MHCGLNRMFEVMQEIDDEDFNSSRLALLEKFFFYHDDELL